MRKNMRKYVVSRLAFMHLEGNLNTYAKNGWEVVAMTVDTTSSIPMYVVILTREETEDIS